MHGKLQLRLAHHTKTGVRCGYTTLLATAEIQDARVDLEPCLGYTTNLATATLQASSPVAPTVEIHSSRAPLQQTLILRCALLAHVAAVASGHGEQVHNSSKAPAACLSSEPHPCRLETHLCVPNCNWFRWRLEKTTCKNGRHNRPHDGNRSCVAG